MQIQKPIEVTLFHILALFPTAFLTPALCFLLDLTVIRSSLRLGEEKL